MIDYIDLFIKYTEQKLNIKIDYSSLEFYQRNMLIKNCQNSAFVEEKLQQNKSKKNIQKALEEINLICKNDFEYIQYNLSSNDENFIFFPTMYLKPPNPHFWSPSKLSLINRIWTDFSTKRRKDSKFVEIFDFFQDSTNYLTQNDFNILVLYILKSTIQSLLLCDVNYRIKRTKFLSHFGSLLFKYLYTVTKNETYFSILEKRETFTSFNTTVLLNMVENFGDLEFILIKEKSQKTVYYVCVSEKMQYDPKIKNLSNHEIPLIVKPSNWKYNIEEQNFNFGGYLCNRLHFYPGIHLKSESGYTLVEKNIVDNINFLQKNVYSVPIGPKFSKIFDCNYIIKRIDDYLMKIFK